MSMVYNACVCAYLLCGVVYTCCAVCGVVFVISTTTRAATMSCDEMNYVLHVHYYVHDDESLCSDVVYVFCTYNFL